NTSVPIPIDLPRPLTNITPDTNKNTNNTVKSDTNLSTIATTITSST
ncbi:2189_t:CDS:1, partial [Dentiscutata heterogama]